MMFSKNDIFVTKNNTLMKVAWTTGSTGTRMGANIYGISEILDSLIYDKDGRHIDFVGTGRNSEFNFKEFVTKDDNPEYFL